MFKIEKRILMLNYHTDADIQISFLNRVKVGSQMYGIWRETESESAWVKLQPYSKTLNIPIDQRNSFQD